MKKLLDDVKNAHEDYEWYPTTNELLREVNYHFNTKRAYSSGRVSILDIGAGNGKALEYFSTNKRSEYDTVDKYAIEKSKILIDAMPDDIMILGTDFWEQTLVDKKVSMVFCNPPYSEFEDWAVKIIRESNTENIYLVIPERWEKSKRILEAIDSRKAKYTVIYKSDFLNAEDRKARAVVHVVYIHIRRGDSESPFYQWFKDNFSLSSDNMKKESFKEKTKEQIKSLITRVNVIDELVTLYKNDLDMLLETYKMVNNLPEDLMKEIGVSILSISSSLESKIDGLKNVYWRSLFDELKEITNRLTLKNRESILNTMFSNVCIDFTKTNIYAVVVWVLKNANVYIDSQLVDQYIRLSRSENVINYVSNQRHVRDNWRYVKHDQKNHTHYKLDYRMIDQCWKAFEERSHMAIAGVSGDAIEKIEDIFVIARNLGFQIVDSPREEKWSPGKKRVFSYVDINGNIRQFCDISLYKNGNVHYRFCPEFMLKFNIEASRLLGWIRSPHDAAKEMKENIEDVLSVYGGNLKITQGNIKYLGYYDG